jgi:hypothetical protein
MASSPVRRRRSIRRLDALVIVTPDGAVNTYLRYVVPFFELDHVFSHDGGPAHGLIDKFDVQRLTTTNFDPGLSFSIIMRLFSAASSVSNTAIGAILLIEPFLFNDFTAKFCFDALAF